MAFCSKCGKQNDEDAENCGGCGAAVEGGAGEAAQSTSQNKSHTSQGGGNMFSKLMDTPETHFDQADVEANKILSLFSYWGILFLIPLLATKDSPYAKFHINQGIKLFILEIVIGVVLGILAGIGGALSAVFVLAAGDIGGALVGLGWVVFWGLLSLIQLACFALAILGIVNAVQGKGKELPLLGKLPVLKTLNIIK